MKTSPERYCPGRARVVLSLGSVCLLLAPTGLATTAQISRGKSWVAYPVAEPAGSASAPPASPSQGLHPLAFAKGDLDADGHTDLVSVSWFQSPRLTVLFGSSEGFGSPVHYPSPAARDVVVADVTGDGLADVLVAEFGSNGERTTVAMHPNLGGGVLGTAQRTTVATGLRGMAAADFDGDGDMDLAVSVHGGFVSTGTTVRVLLNAGNGSFPAQISLPAADPSASPFALRPWRVAAGDLDGDGDVDLAVATGAQRLSIIENQGPGGGAVPQFAAPVTYSIPGAIPDVDSGVALLDIDGDGDLDVAYSSNSTRISPPGILSPGAVALFANDGTGALAPAQLTPTVPFAAGHAALVAGDVDADGREDLTVVTAGGLAPLINQSLSAVGPTSFAAAGWRASGEGPADVLVFDVDLDGTVEIVCLAEGSASVGVHFDAGAGTFAGPPSYFHGGVGQKDLALGDIDGDGDLDAVVVGGISGFGGLLRVSRNDGSGQFGPPTNYSTPRAGRRVQLEDLDGDGDLDLGWIDDPDGPPYHLETRLNNGSGNFGPQQTWPLNTCGSWDLTFADVDGDGDPDAVVAEALTCFSSPFTHLYVSLNDGSGAFGAPQLLQDGAWGVAAGDIDGDGDVDLVTATVFGVQIRFGDGAGGFQVGPTITLPEGLRRIRLADLDEDGHLDIVVQQQRSIEDSALWLLHGLGQGAFGAPIRRAGAYSRDGAGTTSLDLADVDRDGRLDVVMANEASSDITVFGSEGATAPLETSRHGVNGPVLDVDLGDLDGDGNIDAVVLGSVAHFGTRDGFSVLFGQGPTTVGVTECAPAFPNSSGASAHLRGTGSARLAANDLGLDAEQLPSNVFGFFVTSEVAAFVPMAGGSAGNLCLGGQIGRGVGGQVVSSGPAGVMSVTVDLTALPTPNTIVSASVGETWRFQCWFRDFTSLGAPTSNFTDALAVTIE